jgi:plasmid stability protein
MSSILIRDVPDDVKAALRKTASLHQRSMEAHARALLTELMRAPAPKEKHFVDVMLENFGKKNGLDLPIPARDASRDFPRFENE